MILKIASIVIIVIIVLYLLLGLLLFVETIRKTGGMREAGYPNTFIFVIGAITTMISWPILIILRLLHKFLD